MRLAVWVGLALGSLAVRTAAQSPQERRQIDALRDTLGLVTDTMALHEREALLLRAALRSREEPFYHLYLGTLALRQGELGGVAHFDESAAEFRWASRLAPAWTYAWFGAGSAEFALGDRLAVGAPQDLRRQQLAREAYRRGTLSISRAVSQEPGLAPRLVQVASRALREGFPGHADAVRDALQRATTDQNGQVLLALGRVQRQLGDTGALRSFTKYLASGVDHPLGLVELGRTQLLLGDLSGAMRYLSAAAEPDSLAALELRRDLEPIATEAELQEFDRRSGVRRLEFLRHFWTVRDRLALRTDGERLAEHLRRIAVASREFLVVEPEGSGHLDDRGRIYVRHGEPDERVRYAVPGIEPNESWCYRGSLGDSDLVLHFAARPSLHEFRLIESLQDVVDGRYPSSAGHADPALFRSRSSINPLYRDVPEGKRAVAAYLAQERGLGRRGMQVAMGFDSYRLGFVPEPAAWSSVLASGSTAASAVVQVGFFVPPDSVNSVESRDGRFRFVALDSVGNVLASIDTIVRSGHASLAGALPLRVRAGRLIVHGAMQTNGNQGIDTGIDTITVPSPGDGVLAVGSLLVGSGERGIPISLSDGAEFRLSPGLAIPRDGDVRLAADVFGLAADTKATVRVLLAPLEHPEAWRRWPDRLSQSLVARRPGAGPVVAWRATLSARSIHPGRWRVAVEVTDNRRVARQEAALEVR